MIAVNQPDSFYGHPPSASTYWELRKTVTRPKALPAQLTRAEKCLQTSLPNPQLEQHRQMMLMARQSMARQSMFR